MIHGLRPALAEGGKIKSGHLGSVRQGSNGPWRPPVKDDHFTITKTTRGADVGGARGDLEIDRTIMDALLKEFKDADGKLRTIPIVLHSDDVDEVFPTTYACYTGTKLHCRGDGETALRWKIENRQRVGEPTRMDCTCPYLGATSGPVCKPHGTLHCSIIVDGLPSAGSVHKWRTTSILSIQRIIGSLDQIRKLCGTIRGIPLVLRILPETVQPNGKSTTVYVCHIELRAKDVMGLMDQALRQQELRKKLGGDDGDYKRLVHAPGVNETPEEEGDISNEFHPDAVEPDVEAEAARTNPLKDERGIPLDDPGAVLDNRPDAEPVINDQQRKKLFATLGDQAKRLKVKPADLEASLRVHLKSKYGIDSSKAIALSWIDDILAWAATAVPLPDEPGAQG
jgi:hypothetical protein